jgi:RNA polymerase sigma factor (sigma-70 family)
MPTVPLPNDGWGAITQYHSSLCRFAAQLATRYGIDPDDLFQNTILVVVRAFPSFRGNSQLTTWMYRIMTNIAIDTRGRATRQREQLAEYAADAKVVLLGQDDLTVPDDTPEELRALFVAGLEYATPKQQAAYRAVYPKPGEEKGDRGAAAEYARTNNRSRSAVTQLCNKAHEAAVAGMYLTVARDRDEARCRLLFSDEFMKFGPDSAGVLGAFNHLMADGGKQSGRQVPTAEDLEWLYCKSREGLIRLCSRRTPADADLWRVREYYLPMRLGCQVGAEKLRDAHRDTWREMTGKGWLKRPQLCREMATHGGYCLSELGESMHSRNTTNPDLEVAGVLVYMLGCQRSGLDFPTLFRGDPGPVMQAVHASPTTRQKAYDKLFDYTRSCLGNPLYHKPGISNMVYTWAGWLADRVDAAVPGDRQRLAALHALLRQQKRRLTDGGRWHKAEHDDLADRLWRKAGRPAD